MPEAIHSSFLYRGHERRGKGGEKARKKKISESKEILQVSMLL